MKKLKARKLENGKIIQKERFSKCGIERHKIPNGKKVVFLLRNCFPVPERIVLGEDEGSNPHLIKVSPLSEEEKGWIRKNKSIKDLPLRFW